MGLLKQEPIIRDSRVRYSALELLLKLFGNLAAGPLRLGRLLAFVFCLGVVTVLTANSEARFKILEETTVAEFGFTQGPEHWLESATGVSWSGSEHSEYVLRADGLDKFVYIARVIPPPDEHRFIAISVELKADSPLHGPGPDHGGRMMLVSFDNQQRQLWYWPAIVAHVTEKGEWARYSTVIPVHPGSGALQLVAYALAESGDFRLRDLRISGAEEVRIFIYLRYLLVGGWILSGLGMLYVLCRLSFRTPLRMVTVAVSMVIVIAGLIPQPHLKEGLAALLFGTQDVVFASKDIAERIIKTTNSGDVTGRKIENSTLHSNEAVADQSAERVLTSASAADSLPEGDADVERGQPRYWVPHWRDLDKKAHLISFALLGLLAGVAYRQHRRFHILLCLAVLAGSIQSIQSLSITRESDLSDLRYDLVGIVVGIGLVYLVGLLRRAVPAWMISLR